MLPAPPMAIDGSLTAFGSICVPCMRCSASSIPVSDTVGQVVMVMVVVILVILVIVGVVGGGVGMVVLVWWCDDGSNGRSISGALTRAWRGAR